MKKLREPCFRVIECNNQDKDKGFKFALVLCWDVLDSWYSPIKLYHSRRKAIRDLETAFDNYVINKEEPQND